MKSIDQVNRHLDISITKRLNIMKKVISISVEKVFRITLFNGTYLLDFSSEFQNNFEFYRTIRISDFYKPDIQQETAH